MATRRMTLTLYAMDGPPTGDAKSGSFGFDTPGTVLYTASAKIVEGSANTIVFSDNSGSVLLPEVVGVGLSFGGIDFDPSTSDAGPLLFYPPSDGSSFKDFWQRPYQTPGDEWGLFTFQGGPPVNFGLQITAVPEPGTWISMGGPRSFFGTVFVRRLRKSS